MLIGGGTKGPGHRLKQQRLHCSKITAWVMFALFVLALLAPAMALNPVDLGPVCGSDHKTYPSLDVSQSAGVKVLHCGPCGECSNLRDIGVLLNTRNNITATTKSCSWRAVFFGERAAQKCMTKKIGFTESCEKCWLDNIMCDKANCLWTCFKSILKGQGSETELDKNECLACDENKCGKAFIKCAGANRRTSGIHSDITRNDTEICSIVGM